MDWDSLGEHILSGLAVAVIAALLALFVTSWIIDMRAAASTQRERDLATARDLYRVAGTLFAAWKLWDFHSRKPKAPYDDRQWSDMIQRAASAEGDCESLVVRIAMEHDLQPPEVEALWCLRSAFKQLRYSVRDRNPLLWWASDIHGDEGYRLYSAYKGVLGEVGLILSEPAVAQQGWRRWLRFPPAPADASRRPEAVTVITSHDSPVELTPNERSELTQDPQTDYVDYVWVLVAERLITARRATSARRSQTATRAATNV